MGALLAMGAREGAAVRPRQGQAIAGATQPHGIFMWVHATSGPMNVAQAEVAEAPSPPSSLKTFLGLALASAGVVYGDIGTSPLYAFKESIAHLRGAGGGAAAADVIGVVSLMFWAL